MTDLRTTAATYNSADGAAAYLLKEEKWSDQRDTGVRTALNGINLHGLKILDVACGFGRDVAWFRSEGAEAWGLDISEPLLAKARELAGPYFTRHDMLADAPFPAAAPVDLVWACAAVVHVPRTGMEGFLSRCAAALKPGGQLIICYKVGEGERVMTNLGEALPRLMVYYQPQELVAVAARKGLVPELIPGNTPQVVPTGDTFDILKLRKKA